MNESQRTEFYACLDYVGNKCQMQNADKIVLGDQFILELLSTFWHGMFNAENRAGSIIYKHETQGFDARKVKQVYWVEFS